MNADILCGVEGVTEVRPASEVTKKTKLFEVLNNNGDVTHIIKQYSEPKSSGGTVFKEKAKKERQLNQLLCRCSDYNCKIIEVKRKESPITGDGPVDVTTEILMKCEGTNLMNYRQKPEVDCTDLLHVVFQSALALAGGHRIGVFHGDVKPKNMIYKKGTLQLMNFDILSIKDSVWLLEKYHLDPTSKIMDWTQSYCPPEILKSSCRKYLISPDKIDAYCWGISMLQFLMNMSEAALDKQTNFRKFKNEEWAKALKEIKQMKIPGVEDKISLCLMRLICKCLRQYPNTRLSMFDILVCLSGRKGKYQEIINFFSDKEKNIYINHIRHVIRRPKLEQKTAEKISSSYSCPTLVSTAQEVKKNKLVKDIKRKDSKKEIIPEEVKVIKNSQEEVEKVNCLLSLAQTEIKALLESKKVESNSLFNKIAYSKTKAIKLSGVYLDCAVIAAGLLKNPAVTELNMYRNTIEETGTKFIAAAQISGSSLTSLILNGVQIGDQGAEFLAAALTNRSMLTSLRLEDNDIGKKGAKYLAAALKVNSTLTFLMLSSNDIKLKGAKYISSALKMNSTLRTLGLMWTNIGEIGTEYISDALKFNSTLTTLYLYDSNMQEKGAEFLASALISNSSLTSLDLFESNIKGTGAEYIAAALLSNSTLTTLCLDENNLKESGAESIAAALKFNSTITKLNLTCNYFRAEGAKYLAAALISNYTLTTLDLWQGYIGEKGAELISTALIYNSTLTTLDLSENGIGKNGASFIATALQFNSTLTILDLRRNNIGEKGAEFIAKALGFNSTLKTLDLDQNSIGDRGAEFISTAIKFNFTLTTLNLEDNGIGEEGTVFISVALRANSTLTSLDLIYNNIEDKFKIKLQKAAAVNQKCKLTLQSLHAILRPELIII